MPLPSDEKPLSKLALESINSAFVDRAGVDPDDCTTEEQVALAKRKAELDSFRQDTEARKSYARRIFTLTCFWVAGIYILLLLQGFGRAINFSLGDNILLAAIGSTTANIIGVFFIVTRYFFPKK
jgi:hypothetical protein